MEKMNIILSFMSFMVMNVISSAMFIFTPKSANLVLSEGDRTSSIIINPRATEPLPTGLVTVALFHA